MSESSNSSVFFAGACAGLVSDAITFPVSTVKARLQVVTEASAVKGTLRTTIDIIKQEGWRKMFAGFGAVGVVCAPARAMYFAGYEMSKKTGGELTGDNEHFLVTLFAGPFAQLCGSLLWVPQDVVKERLQVQKDIRSATPASATHTQTRAFSTLTSGHLPETHYRNSLDACVSIFKKEGVRGLYRGYVIHQLVWLPFNGIYLTAYEQCKKVWVDVFSLQHDNSHPFNSLKPTDRLPAYAYPLCAAAAGAVASVITSPLDVMKTRIQTQGTTGMYNGILDCAVKMYKGEGFASFFRGLGARVLFLAPNVALTMATYEPIKRFLETRHLGN